MSELIFGLRLVFRAEVASLFLWNTELKQFILRAQDGWSERNWIGAARYGEWEAWTGSMAMQDSPQCEDLHEFQRQTKRASPYGKYGRPAWGKRAETEMVVRAIALPLRYAARRLGVVTLLIGQTGEKLRFRAETPQTLGMTAAAVSGHLGAAVFAVESRIGQASHEARNRTLRAFTQAFHVAGSDPAESLCKAVASEFGAREAVFFFTRDGARENLARSGAFPPSATREVDERIRRVFRTGEPEYEHSLQEPRTCSDPSLLAQQGVLRQIWIATKVQDKVLGVIAYSMASRDTNS